MVCLCHYSELEECESYLLELNLLLKSMEVMHRTYSAPAITSLQVSVQTRVQVAKRNVSEVFYLRKVSMFVVGRQASAYDNPKKEKRPRRWRSKNNGKEAKATLQVCFCFWITYS